LPFSFFSSPIFLEIYLRRRVKFFRKFPKGEGLKHLRKFTRQGLAPIHTPRNYSEICAAFGTVWAKKNLFSNTVSVV
jgi:hypothetical protein